MAAGDLALHILIDANSGGAQSVIGNVSRSLSMLASNPMAAIAVGAAAGAAALIGIGVAATRSAADFQTAMLSNVAHAGLAKSQFDNVSQSVLAMSTEVGRSPTQLAEALYPILSAFSGIQNQSAKSAIALATLKMSFQAVAGTTTDGTAVANAAVGTFNALGLATNNAATNAARMTNLFDVMDKTTQLGNMQWDTYKNVVSKLAVAIQGTGISFNESQAALAEMTNEGFTAQRASTYLSNTFTTLAIKTNSLSAHAKKLGIDFDAAKYGPMSLADKIAYLNQITDGNKQKLLALMGNNSTALKTFNALSVGIDGYKSNLDALNHSQGALKSSFDTASQGFNFQMQKVKAVGDVLMITIGTKLLPIVSSLASHVVPVIQQFTAWLTSGNRLQGAMNTVGDVVTHVGNFIKSDLLPPALQIAHAFMDNVVPAVQHLGAVVMPLVNGFINWTVKSGALHNALGFIGDVISTIVSGIGGLINGIANVIGFFSQNQAAALALLIPLGALGGYFVFLGVSAVASFIAAAPAMIAGFITGAAAAWTMAAGVIAATWPFLLIGAAVGLVIVIIVLLVQHWGQVVSFLRGVWAGFSSWFMGALHAVGNFFSGVWNGIISFLKAAWAFILNVIKIGAITVLVLMTWPFLAVAALFIWLYNHNTYFKMLIDAIVGFVKNGVKWLTDLWNGIVNWIVAKWNYLHAMATVYFTMLYFVIYSKILQVQNFVHGILVTIGNFFIDRWNNLVTNTTALWNKISGIFSSAWNTYIAKPLGSLWNSISGWFKQLGQGALDSGKNFIQMLVNGITSGAGAIWNAVTGIAKNIWSALGFHSPTEAGPGRDADRWMPNLINMLVSGLNAGVPAMHRAALNVAAPLAQLSGGGSFALSGAHAGNAFALSGSNGNAFALGNGGQTIVIQVQPATANINLDHRKVGEGVMQYAQKEIRLQGTVRNK